MKHHVSLTVQITMGMVAGILFGLAFGPLTHNIRVIGDIFLRLIQMAVIVLIFGAVIEALGTLKPRVLGKLDAKTGLWFLGTTMLAAAIGLGSALLFKPGLTVYLDQLAKTGATAKSATDFNQTLFNFFPTNIFESLAQGNVIQVIVFAVLFGIVLSRANQDGEFAGVLKLVSQFNQLTVKLVMLVMKLAPLGIAALMAGVVADNGSHVLLPLLQVLGHLRGCHNPVSGRIN